MMNYSVASTLAPYNVHHLLSAMDIRKFLTKKSDDASLASASSSNTPSTSAVEDPMVVDREVPPDSSEEADDAQQNEGKKQRNVRERNQFGNIVIRIWHMDS